MELKDMSLTQLRARVSELIPIANRLAKERQEIAQLNWELCDKPGVPYNKELEDEMEAKMWEKEQEHVTVGHQISLINIWINKHQIAHSGKIEALTPKN